MILKLTLDLPEEQQFIKITRLLGRTLLEHLHAVTQDIDEVELVVGELCANVVRHAHSNHQRYQVVLEYHSDKVVVLVSDQGPGFSIHAVPAPGTERADFEGLPERIGGYGLKLVELLSDQLEFRSTDPNGTTVRAEKKLHYDTQADADQAKRLASSGGSATLSVG